MQEDIVNACNNCMYAKNLNIGSDVICKYNGLVSGSGICKKYKYNLFIKPPARKRNIQIFTSEDFSIE